MSEYVTVTTTQGRLRGIAGASGAMFLGVPYGAPTGGAGRFAPPRPAEPWHGVRDAFEFGPAAPQNDTRIGEASGDELLALLYPRAGWPLEGGSMSEDCLRLNVWSPAADDVPRPVMVWLHGGGFQHGSGNEMAFNGDILARTENVVVVTVTHRLGVLGTTAFAGEPGSGVAGMLDIVLALEWVRDNIAVFGGDPGNVTVFGQSGGGMKTSALMGMPAAAGLFHKAIVQSGPGLSVLSRESALSKGAELLDECGVASLEQLREVPLEQVLGAQLALVHSLNASGGFGDMLNAGLWPGPSLDPQFLPRQLHGAGVPDGARGIPLLIGTAVHDLGFILAADPRFAALTEQSGPHLLDAFAPGAGAVWPAYRSAHPDEGPCLLTARIATDFTFARGSRRFADVHATAAPVYGYRFAQPTDVLGGVLGACHSLDLAYVFGTVDRIPMTGHVPHRHQVSRLMMHTWATFARTGNPGNDLLPAWKEWGESRHEMYLGPDPVARPAEDILGA